MKLSTYLIIGIVIVSLLLGFVFADMAYETKTGMSIISATSSHYIDYVQVEVMKETIKQNTFGSSKTLSYELIDNELLIDGGRTFRFMVKDDTKEYKIKKDKDNLKLKEDTKETFVSTDTSNGLEITQNISYYDDGTPTKVVHYLLNTNNDDITNPKFYYVFTVNETDEIEIDGEECINEKCIAYDWIDRENIINFNNEYDFSYQDLIDTGFTYDGYYFENGELFVGFKKGDLKKGELLELDPLFATNDIEGMDMYPFDKDSYVIGYCDETANDMFFTTLYANGTLINTSTVNDNVQACPSSDSHVAVSTFNESTFVYFYYSSTTDDVYYNLYDKNGDDLGGISIDDAGGIFYSLAVLALNESVFALVWKDYSLDDHLLQIIDVHGNNLTNHVQIDSSSGDGVGMTLVNETNFIMAWDTGGDVLAAMFDFYGTKNAGNIKIDDSVSTSRSVSIAMINDFNFAVVWGDSNGYVDFAVSNITFSSTAKNIRIDSSAGSDPHNVQIARLNDSAFVMSVFDDDDNRVAYYMYDIYENQIIGETVLGILYDWGSGVVASKSLDGDGICDDNFVVAWENFSIMYSMEFHINGSEWNGICSVDEPPAPDTDYPLFSNYADNTKHLVDNGTAFFNVTITSTNGTIFLQINNTNYTSTNSTASFFNATVEFTKGGTYNYQWLGWGNGTDTLFNISETQSYVVNTTTPATCNYPGSGNWIITIYCNFSSRTFNIDGNLTIASGGTLNLTDTIINFNSSNQYIEFDNVADGNKLILNGTSQIN